MWHNDRKEMMNFKRGEYMVKMFFSPQWTQAAWKKKLEYSQQFIGVKPVGKRGSIRKFFLRAAFVTERNRTTSFSKELAFLLLYYF